MASFVDSIRVLMLICLPADELLEPAVRLAVQRTERQWYSAVRHRCWGRRVQSAADQSKRKEESDKTRQERSPFVFSSALRRSRTWFVDVATRIFSYQKALSQNGVLWHLSLTVCEPREFRQLSFVWTRHAASGLAASKIWLKNCALLAWFMHQLIRLGDARVT